MELDGVKTGFIGAPRARDKVVNDAVAFFVGQLVRFLADAVNRMGDLEADLAALVMDGGDEFFETVDVLVAADLQAQPRMDVMRTYTGMLRHYQSNAGAGTIHIVLDCVLGDKSSRSRRVGEHRRHYDPVAELHRVYLNRCKEADSVHFDDTPLCLLNF